VWAGGGSFTVIAADGFNSSFSVNNAGQSGGAIYMGGTSVGTFISEIAGYGIIFESNSSTNMVRSASYYGGAVYVGSNSTVLFKGSTTFLSNSVLSSPTGGGGAVAVTSQGFLSFVSASKDASDPRGVELSFINNTAINGAAVYVGEFGRFVVNVGAIFSSNTSLSATGEVLYNAGSTTFYTSGGLTITFADNNTNRSGKNVAITNRATGLIYFIGDDGETIIYGDIVGVAGGSITKREFGSLQLKGDGSGYKGNFRVEGGQVVVSSNFFDGASNISSGTVTFLDGSKLVGSGEHITLGDYGVLIFQNQDGLEVSKRYLWGSGTIINRMGNGAKAILRFADDNKDFTGTLIQDEVGLTIINGVFNATSMTVAGVIDFSTGSKAAVGEIYLLGNSQLLIAGKDAFTISSKVAGGTTDSIDKVSTGILLTIAATADLSGFGGIFNSWAGLTEIRAAIGASAINILAGTMTFNAAYQTDHPLEVVSGTVTLTGASVLNIVLTANNLALLGQINGTVAGEGIINKSGVSTLTISGNNSNFTGTFNQTAGITEFINTDQAIQNLLFMGTFTITNAGSQLWLSTGVGDIANTVRINLDKSAVVKMNQDANVVWAGTVTSKSANELIVKQNNNTVTLVGNFTDFKGRFLQEGSGTTTIKTAFNASSISVSGDGAGNGTFELVSGSGTLVGNIYLFNGGRLLLNNEEDVVLSGRIHSMPLGERGSEIIEKTSNKMVTFTANNSSFTGTFIQRAGTTTIISNVSNNSSYFFNAATMTIETSRLVLSSATVATNKVATIAGDIKLIDGSILEINGWGQSLIISGQIFGDDNTQIIKSSTKTVGFSGDNLVFTGTYTQTRIDDAVSIATITGGFGAKFIDIWGNGWINFVSGADEGKLHELNGQIALLEDGSRIYINTVGGSSLAFNAKLITEGEDHIISKSGQGELILYGNYDTFVGTFTQSAGTTSVYGKFFSGDIVIANSRLEIKGDGSISAGTITFTYANAAASILINGGDLTYAGQFIAGPNATRNIRATIEKSTGTHLTLSGDNSGFRGTFVQTAGTTTVSNKFSASSIAVITSTLVLSGDVGNISGIIYLDNGGVLNINSDKDIEIAGKIYTVGGFSNQLIEHNGTGLLTFRAENDVYEGDFVQNAGKTLLITVKKQPVFGARTITLYNGTELEIDAVVSGSSLPGNVFLYGGSTLTVSGTGDFQLNGNITAANSGGWIIKEGE
jgi:hypothetical protein